MQHVLIASLLLEFVSLNAIAAVEEGFVAKDVTFGKFSILNMVEKWKIEWLNRVYLPLFEMAKPYLNFANLLSNGRYLVDYILENYESTYDAKFDYNGLSSLDLSDFSRNPGVHLHHILKHSAFPWDYWKLGENPNFDALWLHHLQNKTVNWAVISKSAIIRVDVIMSHPGWQWNLMSENPHLTIAIVRKYRSKKWCWASVSKHKNITMEDINNNIDLPWDWFEGVSNNPNLCVSALKMRPAKYWDWRAVSMNPGISLEEIIDYPEFPWVKKYVSQNPNISLPFKNGDPAKAVQWKTISSSSSVHMADIVEHPNNSWRFDYISKNPNLTIDIINLFPEQNWEWRYISEHSDISMLDVVRNPQHPWDWNCIRANPTLCISDVVSYPELPWQWNKVICNDFALDKELYVERKLCGILLCKMLNINNANKAEECSSDALTVFGDDCIVCMIQSYL